MKINNRRVIKTYRVENICSNSQRYAMWCGECVADVELASLKEAAEIVQTNTNEIINQVAQGKIHIGFRPEALLFCLDSLLCVKESFTPTAIGS